MTNYNTDFALWAEEQAAKLRAGKVSELDRDNIAEELESLARALRRELVERLARLLQNLLQWEYLDGLRLPVWYSAIVEERSMIPRLLEDAPSLDQNWSKAYAQAWDIAREKTLNATGLAAVALPLECPYSREQVLDVTLWPGRNDHAVMEGLMNAAAEQKETERSDSILRHLKGNAQMTDVESMQDAIATKYETMKRPNISCDPARNILIGLVDGHPPFESDDPIHLADMMFGAGVRQGEVQMPDWREGEIAPTSGQKIAFNRRLNQLGREQQHD